MSEATPESRVLRWIDDIVIGLNLCPFASEPRKTPGALRVHLAETATDMDTAIDTVLTEARQLLDSPAQEVRTTLVVFPHCLGSLSDLLEVAAQVESTLVQAGAEGILQVATFHPDYLFADTPTDDPANYTNRAPHPIVSSFENLPTLPAGTFARGDPMPFWDTQSFGAMIVWHINDLPAPRYTPRANVRRFPWSLVFDPIVS